MHKSIPMKKNILLLYLLCFVYAISIAQNKPNHNIIRASGKIPEQIISNPQKKFWKDLSDQKYKKSDDKENKDFLLENSFYTTKMLSSGYVLFNDGVSKYLQSVLDQITLTEPELKDKLKVYAVKSAEVNAYCTFDGIILVNLGLVAQCENEAQLAFVLCHEIAHYKKQHMKDKYFEAQKMKRGEGAYKYMTAEQKYFAKNYYSQDKEREADSIGLEMYMKTPYSKKGIIYTFDILKYAETPFDEIRFSTSFFEDSFYQIPPSYILSDVQMIATVEKDSNRHSSHPEIKQRKQMVQNVMQKYKDADAGSVFINSTSTFYEVRNESRYELSRLSILEEDYIRCLYNSFLLLRSDPDDTYLKAHVAYSLSILSKYATKGKLSKIVDDYQLIEGEEQNAYYFIKQISKNPYELCLLATRMSYLAYEADTSNQFLKQHFLSLVNDLEETYKFRIASVSPDSLRKKELIRDSILSYEKSIFNAATLDSAQFAALSKYEKIKYTKQISKWQKDNPTKYIEKSNQGNDDYYNYVFSSLYNDATFYKAFADKEELMQKQKEEREKILSKLKKSSKKPVIKPAQIIALDENKKYSDKKKSKIEAHNKNENSRVTLEEDALVQKELDKKKKPLDIKKVVVVRPTYDIVNEFRANQIRHIKGFQRREKYMELINEVSGITKQKVEIVDHMRLNEDDIAKFNDLALLNEIIAERLSHDEDIKIPMTANHTMTQEMIKKYGTKYFLWTGVVSVAKKRKPYMWIASIYVVPVPLLAVLQATPKYETYYYSLVYDLETGSLKIVDLKRMPLRDRNTLLKNNFYNT